MFMGRSASANQSLPSVALDALEALGGNLRVARERRGESLRAWAARMDVSVPTLQRMERGDPSVAIGVYATAIWLCGLASSLAAVADPSSDTAALELEIARTSRRRR